MAEDWDDAHRTTPDYRVPENLDPHFFDIPDSVTDDGDDLGECVEDKYGFIDDRFMEGFLNAADEIEGAFGGQERAGGGKGLQRQEWQPDDEDVDGGDGYFDGGEPEMPADILPGGQEGRTEDGLDDGGTEDFDSGEQEGPEETEEYSEPYLEYEEEEYAETPDDEQEDLVEWYAGQYGEEEL